MSARQLSKLATASLASRLQASQTTFERSMIGKAYLKLGQESENVSFNSRSLPFIQMPVETSQRLNIKQAWLPARPQRALPTAITARHSVPFLLVYRS